VDNAAFCTSAAGFPRAKADDTAAVQQVTYPWVAQTRPGGKILILSATPYHNGPLSLVGRQRDGTANGHIAGRAALMRLYD
jgi:hypothetical protein